MPLAVRLPRRRSIVSSRPRRTGPLGEGVEQKAQQHAPGRASAPGSAVEHAMVVGESPLAGEPGNPQQAGDCALAGR